MNITPTFRKFHLQRHEDASGVSGVGRVAEGIVFSDGMTVLRWLSACGSTNIYNNWESVLQVHGHGGNTEIVFDDPAPENNVSNPVSDDEELAKSVLGSEARKKILAVAEAAVKAEIAEIAETDAAAAAAAESPKKPRRKKKATTKL